MTTDELRRLADQEESIPYQAEYRTCDYVIDAIREAADEIDRLKTWNGLMQTLDEFYPTDIVPTLSDDPGRDDGARIVSLLRTVDELRHDADEIDRLNARVTSLEAFARELWGHDNVNMHIEADEDFPGDYCDWCRGMVAKARELGIEE